MIPFDFDYYRPDSIEEAVNLYKDLVSNGKKVLYYSGGTEIITMARRNDIYADAVVDIKGIPECSELSTRNNKLVIGGTITLTQISEANPFPLLSKASGGLADHTARTKITIGGNICGKIIYREAVLAFLLCNSDVVIAGPNGIRISSINLVFNKTLQLNEGEFLVQLITDLNYIYMPFFTFRRTKQGKVGYPLISMAALRVDNEIRTAFSGICAFPFRSKIVEDILNDRNLPMELRAENIVNNLPCEVQSNVQGSADYKKFILKNALIDTMKILEENI